MTVTIVILRENPQQTVG